jgi:Domain of unknown function (DUF3854)
MPVLAPRHVAFLAARAVTGPVLARRGYRTVTTPAELTALGFPERQARDLTPGLLIPRYGLGGKPSWPKVRPDPEGRNGPPRAKYASPGGSWNFLDALPGTPLSGDIWCSAEGFVKADAMAATGLPVVAFDGVWGWKSQGAPLLGLETLARPGRWFHVVCDSDYRTNPRVAGAMCALARWLRSEGARVRILHPPGDGKLGVDDFLAAGGRIAQLVEAGRPSPMVRRGWALRALAGAWA